MIALDAAPRSLTRKSRGIAVAFGRGSQGGCWGQLDPPDAPEPEIAWTAIPGRIEHV